MNFPGLVGQYRIRATLTVTVLVVRDGEVAEQCARPYGEEKHS